MTTFRMVRVSSAYPNENRAYRVESTELLTEQEAMLLMRELGSPYQGKKYDDRPFDRPTTAPLPSASPKP